MNPRIIPLIAFLTAAEGTAASTPGTSVTVETEFLRLGLTADGQAAEFTDRASGRNYGSPVPFAVLRRANQTHPSTGCLMKDGKLTLTFQGLPGRVGIAVAAKKQYLVFEILSVGEEGVEALDLCPAAVSLTKMRSPLSGVAADDDFAACVRALDLKGNLRLHGGARSRFEMCFEAKHGMTGAKFALVGCPTVRLRGVLQELVRGEGLLGSPLGGPFALDAEENRGSYVFASVSEANVDSWIALAKKAGLAQIHFIGWERSLGHYEPRKDLFPGGLDGMKAVVDRIHAAGLRAGMHTLTGGISVHDPFASPVPDRRLAKDASFVLAERIDETAREIPTTEEPKGFDTIWAYGGRGNVVQIDDELIQYSGLAPGGFVGCRRGAFGTKAAPHAKGASVHHLFVRYQCFQPDENSTLVDEVAERIARVFNTCGFDMIYMDGAEGMSGGWHGVSKMRAAIFRRLRGRVLVEASEWGHHSWPFHSRIGAYDHPNWGLKRFVDAHGRDTDAFRAASLLPAQLGWWAILGPDADHEAIFRDEVEYLCVKALARDAPLSFQGLRADGKPPCARQDEYLDLIGRYEGLRLARAVPESILQRLRAPKEDFRLAEAADGGPQFLPVDYLTHKVLGLKDPSVAWTVRNRFSAQPLRLRLQVLYSAAPADAPEAVTLAEPRELVASGAAPGVTLHTVAPDFHASSTRAARAGAWAKASRTFEPPRDLRKFGAIRVAIEGDGSGALFNFQLTNPPQFWGTWDEHYVTVDFTGRREFELHLRERDAERFGDYTWPYGGLYEVYRSPLIRSHVSALNVYVNEIPAGGAVRCRLGPVRAVPVVKVKLSHPAIRAGGRKLVFPVTLESGQYLEMESASDCRLYDESGVLLGKIPPQGDVPTLAAGENALAFDADGPEGYAARANVTVIVLGEPLK